MAETVVDPLSWFPYEPRPQQDRAVVLAANTFAKGTVGMLSAECGVGKTIAALAGYLAARGGDQDARLYVLTRTHSQSRVFEEELNILQENIAQSRSPITATSMVSRRHVCPIRYRMDTESSMGFMRGCATMIKTGRCTHYWNFYKKKSDDRTPKIREQARELVNHLLSSGVVTREIVESAAEDDGVCPYEILRWCARQSRIIIGPYAYLFKERVRNALLSSVGQHLSDADILVDEAHNLPEHVLSSEAASLSGQDLQWLRDNRANVKKETGVSWIVEVIDFLWETLLLSLEKLNTKQPEVELDKWQILPGFVDPSLIQLLMERTRVLEVDELPTETPLDRLIEFLFAGLRASESDDWHVTASLSQRWNKDVSLTNGILTIRPLNAAGLIAPVLRRARAAMLMSGTFRPTNLYAALMGVKGALTEDLGSPYPKASRLVLLDREISTKYTERGPNLWRAIGERIESALVAMPAEKTALIAFPSYQVMEQVLSYNIDCGFRERVVESKEARIENLTEEVHSGPKAVFLVYGGKFSEGVDLVSNGRSLVDMIIGVGIPFSPPTSYQRALQDWYESRFGEGAGYFYSSVIPSVRKVVQLVGRLRRSPDDWGIVILLDQRFERHIKLFGEDVVSDLWPYRGVGEMRNAISSFLDMRRVG
ncbi:MAG: ATP-dependent DNA helicase [Candidatus Thorarchaeota archaeon]|nr:ATP-dependent DNA helicase [Candidatus Thorarchaeota archaeon]